MFWALIVSQFGYRYCGAFTQQMAIKIIWEKISPDRYHDFLCRYVNVFDLTLSNPINFYENLFSISMSNK